MLISTMNSGANRDAIARARADWIKRWTVQAEAEREEAWIAAATAQGKVRGLQVELCEVQQTQGNLQEELAAAQRPFWRWLFGHCGNAS